MLAARGIDVSYETLRRWALKFGSIIARKLRRGRPRPDGRWHLDEVFVSINGRQFYVWRAVDSEGEVLDILVQPRRDRKAALKLMRKLLKRQGITPAAIVTDKLGSYSSALRELGVARRHELHTSFALSQWLMGILCPVVFPATFYPNCKRQL